jgi:hypothetical protein
VSKRWERCGKAGRTSVAQAKMLILALGVGGIELGSTRQVKEVRKRDELESGLTVELYQ